MEHKIVIIILVVALAMAIVFFLGCLLFAIQSYRDVKEMKTYCDKVSFELQELRNMNSKLRKKLSLCNN